MKRTGIIALVLTGMLAAGCSRHAAAPLASSAAGAAAGTSAPLAADHIDWYQGGVESAFEKAKAENKPVFLYWGASWCPPCHELKATVFSRPDFIEKLKLFIPVYLDGDDPGAQKWGEVFGVSGYPTVLVMKADRTELARISGGLDLSQYADVLDMTLGDVRPIRTVLAEVRAGGARPLSKDDCHRLAYYEWDLTDDVDARAGELAATLGRAAMNCGSAGDADRSRLAIQAADLAANAEADAIEAGKPLSAVLTASVDRVDSILQDPLLSLKVADALQNLSAPFFEAVARLQPDRIEAWRGRYATTMESMSQDPRFSAADHLYALYAKLAADKALDARHLLSRDLVGDVQHRIDVALAQPLDEHARASVVNAALNIEELVGDDERAYAIVRQQMAQSKSPWYYMLDLAGLDEKQGHADSAVDWLSKAYAQAQGAATRFQWGTQYVEGLVRMTPSDETRIREAALSVLGELDGPDRIYSRTRKRLEKLDKTLTQWNQGGGHAQVIAALRARMNGICGKLSANDPAREACIGFLSKTQAAAAAPSQ